MSYTELLRYLLDGEPVNAGTANRVPRQLDQKLSYLWDVLQAANIGATVYARQQTISESLKVGQPVFYNSVSQQFEAASAVVETDNTTGYLTVAASAQVWGIVAVKHNRTLADILLFGYASLDISEATDVSGETPAGLWYLSGASVGTLTQQRPPVSVLVLSTDGNGHVMVNPRPADFLDSHRHFSFSLHMLPAGQVTPPTVGDPHVITAADSLLPGWLPADDPIFDSLAPAGAKFGYNLSEHASLLNLWPPLPVQSAAIIMQRPSAWDADNERRSHGEQLFEDTVIIDRNGIWWMTDCYDAVPWPTNLDTTSSASISAAECSPGGRQASLKLYFAKVNFETDANLVRSLVSKDPRLTVTCKGSPAISGDLELNLDLQLVQGDDLSADVFAFKTYNAESNTFRRGPVATGIYANSNNVSLVGERYVDDTVLGRIFFGRVGVSVSNRTTQELPSRLVRLDGATEESNPVLYIGLPSNYTSAYVVEFEIPADAPVAAGFRLRLRLLGRTIGTLPQLITSYFKVSRPSAGLLTPVPVTPSYTPFNIITVTTLTVGDQSVEALSDVLEVAPGDLLYIRIQRTPATVTDAYAGELGVMQQTGLLSAIT